MIRTTVIKNLRAEVVTNTPLESYSGNDEASSLNVCYSAKENRNEEKETALAKTSEGEIVRISFSNPEARTPGTLNFIYRI